MVVNTMGYLVYIFSTVFLLLLLCGCYEQNDELSISPSGEIHINSLITVADEDGGYTFEYVEESLDSLIKEVEQAGWVITKTVFSRKHPYTFNVKSVGNIDKIHERTDLCSVYKLPLKGLYSISFGAVNFTQEAFRTITIQSDNIVDRNGDPVHLVTLSSKERPKCFYTNLTK